MTTIYWIGTPGDWSTASDWSTDTVPGPSDEAVIAAPGSYTVTSSADETVDSLYILDKRATLFVTGPSTFTMTEQQLANDINTVLTPRFLLTTGLLSLIVVPH